MRKKSFVIFYTKNSFLLLQKSKNNLWELPGGKKNRNESFATAAYREAYEETGYIFELENSENIKIDSKTDELILFFFKVDKEFYCNLSKEHKDYKWVSLCDSKKIVLSPKSRRLIKHIKDKVF